MKKADAKIGNFYLAKVSQKLTVVRLDDIKKEYRGYQGTNMLTGRNIRFRTAGKFRQEVWLCECGKFTKHSNSVCGKCKISE